ncbi:MAG: VWA domain-containing protein [Thermoplasmatota archaeon]
MAARALPMVLPDCRAADEGWSLSPRQRDELVRILAQEGRAGLEAWLRREEARDPWLRRRVQAEMERLERAARERRSRLRERFGAERRERLTPWEERLRQQSEREAELRRRLASAPLVPAARLVGLSAALDQATAPPRPGFWNRVRGWLLAAWVWLVSAWVRTVRALTGRKPPPRTVQAGGHRVDLVRLARDHPELMARLRLKPEATLGERMRSAWDRLLGREDYAERVTRMMEEEQAAAGAERELAVRADHDLAERELEALRQDAERTRRARDQEESALEDAQARELAELEAGLSQGPYQALAKEVLQDFSQAGLVDTKGRPTHLLLERFSALIAADELGDLPGGGAATPGSYAGGDGEYERGPLLSHHELGAIDLASSLVQARTRHPQVRHLFDEDALVHREVRSTSAHVVVIIDTSGSMEEAGRLEAAKRVALVLHRAVRLRRDDARIDLLQMETSVHRVDLAGCWNAQPGGFTNFAAALREARRLLDASMADRRIVYLITDGLPEARPLPDGGDKADNPGACLPPALEEARRLRRSGPVRLVLYQLESRDERFVDAANRIAKAAGGRTEFLDPQDLLRHLVVDYQATL